MSAFSASMRMVPARFRDSSIRGLMNRKPAPAPDFLFVANRMQNGAETCGQTFVCLSSAPGMDGTQSRKPHKYTDLRHRLAGVCCSVWCNVSAGQLPPGRLLRIIGQNWPPPFGLRLEASDDLRASGHHGSVGVQHLQVSGARVLRFRSRPETILCHPVQPFRQP